MNLTTITLIISFSWRYEITKIEN